MLLVLTMCSCRGDSPRTILSDVGISLIHPSSITWGDTAGIKSCTSASTGGGEGCLITCIGVGISVASKEIREGASSARFSWKLSLGVRNDSTSDLCCSEMLLSFSLRDPSSEGCWRLFVQADNPTGWI